MAWIRLLVVVTGIEAPFDDPGLRTIFTYETLEYLTSYLRRKTHSLVQ